MGSVYLVSDGELSYYGSTEATLKRRLEGHRSVSNCCRTKLLNIDKMEISEVEFVEDVSQLEIREKWWIQNNECVNYKTPLLTKEEKLALHRARSKKYYEKNKKLCGERSYALQKKRDIERPLYHCECGSIVKDSEIRRHHKTKKHNRFIMK